MQGTVSRARREPYPTPTGSCYAPSVINRPSTMLITTSQDLLFVVLAFCALWITVFLSWFLYYLIAILRDTEKVVHAVQCAVEKVDELAHMAHQKFERSATSVTLIAQALKELVVWGIRERTGAAKEPAKEAPKAKKRK